MRLIKDGNYNLPYQMYLRYCNEYETFDSVVEPSEQVVLSLLVGGQPSTQYINYYLQETGAGYIFGLEDAMWTKAGFSYLKFLQWIDRRYENKEFSWQSVAGDVE